MGPHFSQGETPRASVFERSSSPSLRAMVNIVSITVAMSPLSVNVRVLRASVSIRAVRGFDARLVPGYCF